jgi:hypothetical protein
MGLAHEVRLPFLDEEHCLITNKENQDGESWTDIGSFKDSAYKYHDRARQTLMGPRLVTPAAAAPIASPKWNLLGNLPTT